MKKWTLLVVLGLLASQASAQITDPEQRMRWFDLQRLATDTAEIEACQFLNLPEASKYTAAFYKAASETSAAIEAYIAKYPDGRGKQETPNAYRYRVWDVALKAGRDKAWAGKRANESLCRVLLMSR
jgi:hypothetical protein